MTSQPNILFLMADQFQGRVLEPDHPCQTPHLDRLASQGMRFRRAYTPNAVCSPARASLMTGLLPHNHGVLHVMECVDKDQSLLRTGRRHWAQVLTDNGYRTAYFGKWHIDHEDRADRFGWQIYQPAPKVPLEPLLMERRLTQPPGYAHSLLYGVTDIPAEKRSVGLTVAAAGQFLAKATTQAGPWCCFVSCVEPHDPFICGRDVLARYNAESLELPPNAHDDLAGRPGLYCKAARIWADLTDQERCQAMACYYASITEVDRQYGQLLDQLRASGQWDNTLVLFTSDHGELLGAHGLYAKNVHAGEEVYNIPLILRGPGIPEGITTDARVGTIDLYATLMELTGCAYEPVPDSSSLTPLIRDPSLADTYTGGYAEYFGARMYVTQRIVWDGPWKYIFNGFDEDELYNLDTDPYEMTNLITDPAQYGRIEQMCRLMWRKARATGDNGLVNSDYASYRLAPFGPRG